MAVKEAEHATKHHSVIAWVLFNIFGRYNTYNDENEQCNNGQHLDGWKTDLTLAANFASKQ